MFTTGNERSNKYTPLKEENKSFFSESRIYVLMYQQVIKIYICTSVTSNTTLVSECSLLAKAGLTINTETRDDLMP